MSRTGFCWTLLFRRWKAFHNVYFLPPDVVIAHQLVRYLILHNHPTLLRNFLRHWASDIRIQRVDFLAAVTAHYNDVMRICVDEFSLWRRLDYPYTHAQHNTVALIVAALDSDNVEAVEICKRHLGGTARGLKHQLNLYKVQGQNPDIAQILVDCGVATYNIAGERSYYEAFKWVRRGPSDGRRSRMRSFGDGGYRFLKSCL